MKTFPLPLPVWIGTAAWLALSTPCSTPLTAAVPVDLSGLSANSEISAQHTGDRLTLRWPLPAGEYGGLTLDLGPETPLIRALSVARTKDRPAEDLVTDLDPVTVLTVGQRDLQRNGWTVFFDKVHTRPSTAHLAKLDKRWVRVSSTANRASVTLGDVTAGEFRGEFCFTVYAGSPLIHAETILSTSADARAILYDAGLAVAGATGWERTGWLEATGKFQSEPFARTARARPLAVRHRAVAAEGRGGAIAVFPPPHKFFYPLDFANNFQFNWAGAEYRDLVRGVGLGVRQPLEGDRRFVPWFNAPPGTRQRLGVFYLLARGTAADALREVQRFTNGDRFRPVPGHHTFTSHYHVEHTLEYLNRGQDSPAGGVPPGLETPGFVTAFKQAGVEIVHLAEFHVGRTPKLATGERLAQLKLMHEECARLSGGGFLLLPGEEPNVHLGGHWISFFPKPVYWVLNRGADTPFVEERPGFGKVYHVGSAEDVRRLFQLEHGLHWTAHARIKSSIGFPDAYRERDFFRADNFLGAAWKSMPADLSLDRLGVRVLDLLDDMANWGNRKQVIGEVDVFKIEPDYELYGHMNINYLRLDRVPAYREGWQPVLEALRGGRFFVSTGEVLIPDFTVGGARSGGTVSRKKQPAPVLEASLEWNFPLAFAEVISGDGTKVFRERIELADTRQFGKRTLRLEPDLRGRKWVRLEVWDIATNGAFTQPVWLEE